MPPIDTALGLSAVVLLILVNGVFVAAEFALVAVDRGRVERQAADGDRSAARVLAALSSLPFNLSGTQLAITLVSLVLGFVAEPTVADALHPLLAWLPSGSRDAVAVVVALALVTVVQMVVGELVPKGLAIARPDRTARATTPPLRVYGLVFGPAIRLLNWSADRTVRRFGIEPREELRSVRSLEELELLIASSGEEGVLDAEAAKLLTRTFRFATKTAAEALTPRVAVTAVGRDATVADLVALAVACGHSRFPVVGDDLDDVAGVVHAKDALSVPPSDRSATPVTTLMRPAQFVPEGRDLESLLGEMRRRAVPLVVVVDEFGGMAGILTLEDLLEEIVGDIEDEYDVESPLAGMTEALPDGSWLVPGTLHLDEIEELTGLALPEGEYETVAGFVLASLGHLPTVGERVEHARWQLVVTELDRRRVAELRIVAPAPEVAE